MTPEKFLKKAKLTTNEAEKLRRQWRNLWPELAHYYADLDDMQYRYELAVARTKEQARRTWASFVSACVTGALVSIFIVLAMLLGA